MKHKKTAALSILVFLLLGLVFSPLPIPAFAAGVDSNSDGYDDNDFNQVQAFLNMPSASAGNSNGKQINAEYNPDVVTTWSGVEWDTSTIKRVIQIGAGGSWSGTLLAGSLDLSACESLATLSCDNNQITSLDISGTTALTSLSCTNNRLANVIAAIGGQTVDLSANGHGYVALQYAASTLNAIASVQAGYSFKNWTSSGTQVSTNASYSLTIGEAYALVANMLNTVTYDSQGGSEVISNTVANGSKISPPSDPTLAGYTFSAWYKEPACENIWDFDNATVSENITLYAKWTANIYTVDYESNGGSGTTASSSHTYGVAKDLTQNAFARTGYTFTGWNTVALGGGTSFTEKQSVLNLSDVNGATVTLYAQWTANIYTVDYDSNGGSGTTASSSHTYGVAKDLTPNEFVRTGYTFAGWATSAEGSLAYADQANVLNITSVNGTTVTLYAKWTANNYTVAYDSNGGTGTTASSSHTYGIASSLTANGFAKTNYAFAGWATSASGAVVYADQASVVNLSSVNGVTVTLYAKWAANSYTVAYNINGGDGGTTASSNHTIDDAANLTANGYTRTGYTFAGWNTLALGGGMSFTDRQSVLNLSDVNGATVTLYAQWTANIYTVAYDSNGGSGTTASSSHTYGIASSLTANSFTRTGYTFAGWATSAGGAVVYADQASVVDLSSINGVTVTLYAKWAANSYTVAYDINGGDGGTTASSSHTYGIASNLTANSFTRTGYTFVGWNTVAIGGSTSFTDKQSVLNLSAVNGATVTLYAQWTAYTYTIAYEINGGDGGTTASSSHTYGVPKALTQNMFTRTGYAFAGWNTVAIGGGASYTDSQSILNLSAINGATVTLYAQWASNAYSVAYASNGGDGGTMASSVHAFDVAKALTDNTFTKTGYTFVGWNTKADGSGTSYANQENVINLSAISGDTVTIYAEWTINNYAVTFNPQGGSVVTGKSADFNTAITAPADPSLAGYAFVGWYKEPGCVNPWNFSSDAVKENTTLYASWSINTYTVVFNSQGGSIVEDIKASYNAHIGLSVIPVYYKGVFGGWYKEPECVHVWDFSRDVVTENTTLYAKWSGVSLITVLTKSPRYGTVSGGRSYANDTQATVTATPNSGYYFVKWMQGTTQVSTDAVFTFTVSGSTTLTAYFASIPTPRIKVTAIGYSTVKITWSLNPNATSYQIYRAAPRRSGFALIDTVGSGVTTYIDTNGLIAGKTYYYMVAACCTAGPTQTRRLSSVRYVTPKWPVPTLRASLTNYHTANLSWSSVAEADGYKVFRNTSYRGEYTEIADVAAPTLTYQDAGLEYGRTYYYKVLPYDSVGAEKITGTFSRVRYVRPSWPTLRLRAASIANNSIGLSWNAIANADGYEAVRSTSRREVYVPVGSDIITNAYVDSDSLTTGIRYYYKVRPYDMVNGVKVFGPYCSYRYAKAAL